MPPLTESLTVEGIIKAQLKYIRKAWRVNLTVKYKAAAAPIDASAVPIDTSAVPIDASADARTAKITAVIQVVLQAAGFLTKVAVNKEAESSSKDYKGVVEEAAGKKRALTTTKIQKEAAEQRNHAEAKGKHLYTLLKRHCCL